ncbi:hypothetical protein ACFE04_001080 [Oxalis oulophora]
MVFTIETTIKTLTPDSLTETQTLTPSPKPKPSLPQSPEQRLPSSFLARTIAIPCRLSLSSRPTHSRPPKSPHAITTVPSYVVAAASPHNPKTETRRPRRDSRHTPTDAGSPPLSPY